MNHVAKGHNHLPSTENYIAVLIAYLPLIILKKLDTFDVFKVNGKTFLQRAEAFCC